MKLNYFLIGAWFGILETALLAYRLPSPPSRTDLLLLFLWAIFVNGIVALLWGSLCEILGSFGKSSGQNKQNVVKAIFIAGFSLLVWIVWSQANLLRGRGLFCPKSLLALVIGFASAYLIYLAALRILNRGSRFVKRLVLFATLLLVSGVISAFVLAASERTDDSNKSKIFPASARKEQNLLLITLDTTRADALGCYGNANAYTPNLDRAAQNGTILWDAVASIPLTNPSHATLMTGLTPPLHGVRDNAHPMKSGIRTISGVLSDKGYMTGAIISGFPLRSGISGLDRGFHRYNERFSPWRLLPDGFYELYAVKILDRLHFIDSRPFIERTAADVVDAAAGFLRAAGNRPEPFFLWVHFFDPHTPYQPPAPFNVLFGPGEENPFKNGYFPFGSTGPVPDSSAVSQISALYHGEIAYMDRQIGRLMSLIETYSATRNKETITIVAGDHGESLGERGYAFDHGKELFDNSLKVPGIVVGWDRLRSDSVKPNQIVGLDAIADILFRTWAADTENDSADETEAGAAKRLRNPAFHYLESGPEIADRAGGKHWGMIVDGRWKIIRRERLSVFDRFADPSESVDLSDSERQILARDDVKRSLAAAQKLFRSGPDVTRQVDRGTLERLGALGYASGD